MHFLGGGVGGNIKKGRIEILTTTKKRNKKFSIQAKCCTGRNLALTYMKTLPGLTPSCPWKPGSSQYLSCHELHILSIRGHAVLFNSAVTLHVDIGDKHLYTALMDGLENLCPPIDSFLQVVHRSPLITKQDRDFLSEIDIHSSNYFSYRLYLAAGTSIGIFHLKFQSNW